MRKVREEWMDETPARGGLARLRCTNAAVLGLLLATAASVQAQLRISTAIVPPSNTTTGTMSYEVGHISNAAAVPESAQDRATRAARANAASDQKWKLANDSTGAINSAAMGTDAIIQYNAQAAEAAVKLNPKSSAAGYVDDLGKVGKAAGKVATVIRLADHGVNLGRNCKDGFSGGCRDTIGDVVFNEGTSAALSAACGLTGPAAPVCHGSVLTGSLARMIPVSSDGKNLGTVIDDAEWKYIGEPIVNKINTGFTDPLSDDAVAAGMEKARKNRAAAFESARQQAAKEEQDKFNAMVAAQQQQVRQSISSQQSSPSDSGGLDYVNALNTALQQYGQTRQMQSQMQSRMQTPARQQPSSAKSCRPIDPSTGCHAGHDEKAHPGGCKC